MASTNQIEQLREKVTSIFLSKSGLGKVDLKKTLEKLVELNDPWGKHHLAASYAVGLS